MNSNTLFLKYYDKYNLITQKLSTGGDAGDSCHRTMNVLACLKLSGEAYSFDNKPIEDSYIRCFGDFHIGDGEYRRHPDQTRWYSLPENFSRDQCIMLLWAMLTFDDPEAAHEAFDGFKSRRFMNQNTHPNYYMPGEPGYRQKIADPMTPGQWALLLRAMGNKLFYPIVCMLDIFMLIDIPLNIYDDYKSKKKGCRTDAYTMAAALAISTKQKFDNPIAMLARKLLSYTDYKGAIEWIFNGPDSNDPPVHTIMLPLCEKYIDNNEKIKYA